MVNGVFTPKDDEYSAQYLCPPAEYRGHSKEAALKRLRRNLKVSLMFSEYPDP